MTDTPTTKRLKRRYTDEFKRETVALWRSSQATKTMVTAELDHKEEEKGRKLETET